MISVIIPTLQKSTEVLFNLLTTLNNDEVVGEIIVIDNSLKGISRSFSKVKTIIPKENLFVNPSWNLGVKNAKYEYISLFNDDVVIPSDFCSNVYKFLSPDKGMFGVCQDDINNILIDEIDKIPETFEIKVSPTETRNIYFGIIMFCHKTSYYFIPEEMKVWCGDDFLLLQNKNNNKINYEIAGQTIKHLESMSSSSSEFDKIKKNDLEIYSKFDKKFTKHAFMKKNSIIQTIFSLRNEGPYKVLCVLGIRCRFKRFRNA